MAETLHWIWSDATASRGFPCHTSEHVTPAESKPIVFSICNPLYSHEPGTGQSTIKRLQNSTKLPLFKNTLQQNLAAKTKDYIQFSRPIPKSNLQYRSFTNTVQASFFLQDWN